MLELIVNWVLHRYCTGLYLWAGYSKYINVKCKLKERKGGVFIRSVQRKVFIRSEYRNVFIKSA